LQFKHFEASCAKTGCDWGLKTRGRWGPGGKELTASLVVVNYEMILLVHL
jgi:hypothetical protein